MSAFQIPLVLDSTGKTVSLPAADKLVGIVANKGYAELATYDVPTRILIGGTGSIATGTLYLLYFKAIRNFTFSNISLCVDTAIVGGTTTLIRWGIHSLSGLTNLAALLGGTTNDTTAFDSTGIKTKSIGASVSLVRGTRYALSVLATNSVAWGTAPILVGTSGTATINNVSPSTAKSATGQTDLPSGSLTPGQTTGSQHWFRLS